MTRLWIEVRPASSSADISSNAVFAPFARGGHGHEHARLGVGRHPAQFGVVALTGRDGHTYFKQELAHLPGPLVPGRVDIDPPCATTAEPAAAEPLADLAIVHLTRHATAADRHDPSQSPR